jgi:hypothetical protein
MGKVGKRENNPNWRGGRSIASNGYVIVRVGTEHHLADVRGYAYEHRVVAEKKIGRRLRKGEQIHHVDGNRTNNAPDNLQVVASAAKHREAEGRRNFANRIQGQPNPLILCSCGCGKNILKFDSNGRPRRYLSGHNTGERNRQGARR